MKHNVYNGVIVYVDDALAFFQLIDIFGCAESKHYSFVPQHM